MEKTQFKSAFDKCTSDNGAGFTARYWNNTEMEGKPVVTNQVTTPFRFCTSGATVFAPGVELTGFSASYTSVFKPDESGEAILSFYVNGITTLLVNGEQVRRYQTNHGSRKQEHKMKVETGKSYNIEIQFAYHRPDAELNFNIGYKTGIDIDSSVEKVKDADVVVYVSGISPFLEGEEMGVNLPGFYRGDRTDIELPLVQKEFINALHNAGKRVIVVNCSGSAISFEQELDKCDAILQAWYPGQAGGKAVADVLFGDYNPAGRLPVTFYKSVDQLPDFEDYNMTNRTYRYFKGEPLFYFGHGLSYTTFEYEKPRLSKSEIKAGQSVRLTVPIINSGNLDGEEVVQVYLQKEGDADGPLLTLRAFERVFIAKGQKTEVTFELNAESFEWWDDQAQRMVAGAGTYRLMVGGSSNPKGLAEVSILLK